MKFPAALPTVCALAGFAAAQNDAIESGPQAGMKLTKVMAYASSGPFQGKEFDVAKTIGTAPGAILFVKALNRETAPIIRGLDNLTDDYSLLGFKSFTVMLTGDRTAGEARIKTVSNALNMTNPMTVSLDGAEGPGNYAINRNANLTLVLVKDGEVAKCLAFTDTGQKDIPVVTRAIESVTGKLPKNHAERVQLLPNDNTALKNIVARLWAQNDALKKQLTKMRNRNRGNRRNANRNRNMRRGNENENEGEMRRQRRNRGGQNQGGQNQGGRNQRGKNEGRQAARKPLPGKSPSDPKLVSFMRRLINAKTTEELDGIFASVEKTVGDDKAKRKEMALGFVRILGATDYGTDEARARAKKWTEDNGVKVTIDKKANAKGARNTGKKGATSRPVRRR